MTDAEFRRIVWAAVADRAASLADALDATATVPCDGQEFWTVDDRLSQLDGQIRAFRSSLMLRAVMAQGGCGTGRRERAGRHDRSVTAGPLN